MQTSLKVGDVVRRKNDTSGRTRVVKEIYSGGTIAMLDDYLDGWLIWDISKLELVARAPQDQTNAKQIPVRKI
jgi:hypothetical protein